MWRVDGDGGEKKEMEENHQSLICGFKTSNCKYIYL